MKTLTVNDVTVTITKKELKINDNRIDIEFNNFEYHDLTYISATDNFVIAGIDINEIGNSFVTYIYITKKGLVETIRQDSASVGVRNVILLANKQGLDVVITKLNQDIDGYDLIITKKEFNKGIASMPKDVYMERIEIKYLSH